jgi:hypothetical protein
MGPIQLPGLVAVQGRVGIQPRVQLLPTTGYGRIGELIGLNFSEYNSNMAGDPVPLVDSYVR